MERIKTYLYEYPNFFRYLAIASVTVFLAALFIGGNMPGAGQLFPHPWDKVIHICAFGCLAVMAGLAFPETRLFWIVIMVAMVGGVDEIRQIYTVGREASLMDWLADLVGALLAIPAIRVLRQRFYPEPRYKFVRNTWTRNV